MKTHKKNINNKKKTKPMHGTDGLVPVTPDGLLTYQESQIIGEVELKKTHPLRSQLRLLMTDHH